MEEEKEIQEVIIMVRDSTKAVYFEHIEKEYPVDAEPVLIRDFYEKGDCVLLSFITETEAAEERKGE